MKTCFNKNRDGLYYTLLRTCSKDYSFNSLLDNKKPEDISPMEVEKYFGGNICRCTGYRPILTAFKKLAKKDESNPSVSDMEDLAIVPRTKSNGCATKCCENEWCMVSQDDAGVPKKFELRDNKKWFTAYKLQDVFDAFQETSGEAYMLLGGNTGKGNYLILIRGWCISFFSLNFSLLRVVFVRHIMPLYPTLYRTLSVFNKIYLHSILYT